VYYYSYLSASAASMLAACRAGRIHEKIPVTKVIRSTTKSQ